MYIHHRDTKVNQPVEHASDCKRVLFGSCAERTIHSIWIENNQRGVIVGFVDVRVLLFAHDGCGKEEL